jgi:ABC-type multidrug transport system permease subunit
MIARTLKTPFFNLTIDPFGSWKLFNEQVERDTAIVTITILTLIGFYFLSWWWFLIALAVAVMNLLVFLVWMFIRSRKKGTDTGTEIELIKQRLKFWKK